MPAALHPTLERKQLVQSAAWAFLLELLFILALGLGQLPLFHNPFDSAQYIEAQILLLPANSHLTGAQAASPEDEIVYNPSPKRHAPPQKTKSAELPGQNQVNAAPNLGPDHGAVAVYAPAPVIPAYLRNQDLKTSVVIEFLITSQGQATPRLLESSGNDELDAIALGTVKTWRFKPAVQANAPVDSKSRLRIRFEVY